MSCSFKAAMAATSMAVLAGCAVGPNYQQPDARLPAAFATAKADAADVDANLAGWWKSLQDPELDSLIERAIRSNPDLEIALDHLQQARTYESVVVGKALPEVDASGAAGRGTGSDMSKGRADQALRSADNTAGLTHINTLVGFDSVWEIDIFGKLRREYEAARADAGAARAARNQALTVVVADVVRGYIDLRGLQVRVGILKHADDLLRESLRIVNLRYERGITNELDLALAKREFATLESQIAPAEAQVSAAQYALAALIGAYPEELLAELQQPELIPTVPPVATPGLPVDLLKRRPDVVVAERQLAAASARVGVATANLFPQVALVASFGSEGQGWGTTPAVNRHIWSFGPGAEWPLLDFGALDAAVDVAGYTAKADAAQYRRTIIKAVQEVDGALVDFHAQQSRVGNLGDAMLAGQRAVDLANARYERGLTDFLNVVDAERQFYELQQQFAAAQTAQGEDFVAFYKSLGGGWQDFQMVPPIRAPQPAIVATFRRLFKRRDVP
jgi:NodT family efflux transporter outer membrane factor (OMF) lipoprotein